MICAEGSARCCELVGCAVRTDDGRLLCCYARGVKNRIGDVVLNLIFV